MTRGDWTAIIGVGVAVLVGIAAIAATRQWGNRRRKLIFSFEAAPLLPEGQVSGPLQVTFRDLPVPDPHLVTIRLRNIGPADVASSHFDADVSFAVRLNCTMYGVTSTSHPESTTSRAIGGEAVIELRPMLLRRGDEWSVEAVVGGTPIPEYNSSLIDCDIVESSVWQDLANAVIEEGVVPFRLLPLLFGRRY